MLTIGRRFCRAMSRARSVFCRVYGLAAPPRTVGSWARSTHSTSLTTPIPVTTAAPTSYSVPLAASGESSRKGASWSQSSSMRSRGVVVGDGVEHPQDAAHRRAGGLVADLRAQPAEGLHPVLEVETLAAAQPAAVGAREAVVLARVDRHQVALVEHEVDVEGDQALQSPPRRASAGELRLAALEQSLGDPVEDGDQDRHLAGEVAV